jgi:two-component system sensor histidine kinase YesM
MIPLSRELEHVRSYLCIQKARYEDKFDWTIEADDALLAFSVLKLILQPLVENAIYHGIKERRGPGKLAIAVWREADDLILQVKDDGVGLDREKLRQLNGMLADNHGRQGDSGYGIFNVNERIRLSFGQAYGLRFVETDGPGCTVEIRHPLREDNA